MDEKLKNILETEGYFYFKEIEGRGVCALRHFMFTVGLVYGLDEYLYAGRYCYEHLADAKEALNSWDGIGDPKDENWIKHKGMTEYSNPSKNELLNHS